MQDANVLRKMLHPSANLDTPTSFKSAPRAPTDSMQPVKSTRMDAAAGRTFTVPPTNQDATRKAHSKEPNLGVSSSTMVRSCQNKMQLCARPGQLLLANNIDDFRTHYGLLLYSPGHPTRSLNRCWPAHEARPGGNAFARDCKGCPSPAAQPSTHDTMMHQPHRTCPGILQQFEKAPLHKE